LGWRSVVCRRAGDRGADDLVALLLPRVRGRRKDDALAGAGLVADENQLAFLLGGDLDQRR
jgi:hypothetical protein